ncbi:hypothetical protein F4810DRAFT_273398 [Camillea tinctor]|nr:hypothetical protein F4810DRAFT_273398 [Camillea tinctor]
MGGMRRFRQGRIVSFYFAFAFLPQPFQPQDVPTSPTYIMPRYLCSTISTCFPAPSRREDNRFGECTVLCQKKRRRVGVGEAGQTSFPVELDYAVVGWEGIIYIYISCVCRILRHVPRGKKMKYADKHELGIMPRYYIYVHDLSTPSCFFSLSFTYTFICHITRGKASYFSTCHVYFDGYLVFMPTALLMKEGLLETSVRWWYGVCGER